MKQVTVTYTYNTNTMQNIPAVDMDKLIKDELCGRMARVMKDDDLVSFKEEVEGVHTIHKARAYVMNDEHFRALKILITELATKGTINEEQNEALDGLKKMFEGAE